MPPETGGSELSRERLGFQPDIEVNVVGITYRDEGCRLSRSDYAEAARELLLRYGRLSARLEHDRHNPYDEYAVKVLLPTRDDPAGGTSEYRQVGFLPRRTCMSCFRNVTGSKPETFLCECGALVKTSDSVNTRLVEKLGEGFSVDTDDFPVGVVWISGKSDGKNIGIKIGLKW